MASLTRTPEQSCKSPAIIERLEQGTALSFAQHRARINGMHVEECLKVVPTLRSIHTDLRESVSKLDQVVDQPDPDSVLVARPSSSQSSLLSSSSPSNHQNNEPTLSALQSKLFLICDRLETSVLTLEEVRERDRTKRISMEALARAVSEALSSDPTNHTSTSSSHTNTSASTPSAKHRLSPNSWTDEIPPPLALAPPARRKTAVPSSSTPTTTATDPSPNNGYDGMHSAAIMELSEVVRSVQKLHEDMKEGQKQKDEFTRSRNEEHAALEKQFREKLKRYKSRLARYEGLLRANNINLEAISTDMLEGAFLSPDNASKSSAVMNLIEFVLSFLNIGDWLISLLRLMFSFVSTPPKLLSPSSSEYERRVRKRGSGISAYQPMAGVLGIMGLEDIDGSQAYLGEML